MHLSGRAFEVEINVATRDALWREVQACWDKGAGFALATINLDHVTKLERDVAFRDAYAAQDLVVADGNPVVWVSKIAGSPVELMPGSELIEPLSKLAARHGQKVALIGSSDEALAGAAEALRQTAPGLEVVLCIAPPYGFDPEGDAARDILEQVAESGATLVFIALGAPKQELFAAFGREIAPKAGFVSIGAGLDFLSGHQVRAPGWVRAIAMEWLWRMLSSPRRMVGRYTLCALALPGLAVRALGQRFRSV